MLEVVLSVEELVGGVGIEKRALLNLRLEIHPVKTVERHVVASCG